METVNRLTTTFTMDISTSFNAGLNAGLTQALSDGTHDYLYGYGRIAQIDLTPDTGAPDTIEYFIPEALGSVRQLVNQTGAVAFAQTYDPEPALSVTKGSCNHFNRPLRQRIRIHR